MRKRKLDTPDDIDRVCRWYHMSGANVAQIARAEKVSPGTIERVLKENGSTFVAENREEIEQFRKKSNGW